MVGQAPQTPGHKGYPEATRPGCGAEAGSMSHIRAFSEHLASPDYYERLDHLRDGLRDSEKKRLDLEKKFYEYNQSDTFRVKLKYVKLKKYLKEICESEKKARIRNQEYLKRFERVQAHVGNFTTNTEKLQKLKMEYETHIKKMQLLSQDSLGKKKELKDEDQEKVVVQAGIISGTTMSRGLYQPATIFMGRQMSAVSGIGDSSTEQKSSQPTKNFSIPDPHSHQQTAPSSNMTDSSVVQTGSDTQCLNKSDKINGKTSLQIGEKTPVIASVLSEKEQTHCLEIGSNTYHGKSNLSEGKKSTEFHSPLWERLSPKNRTTDLKCDSSHRSEGSEAEILTREHIEVEEERANPPFSAISVSEYCASENKWAQERYSAGGDVSDHLNHEDPKSQKPFRKMQKEEEEESSCSSNDLTVSISEDDLILNSPEPQPNPDDKMEGEDGIEALKLIHAEQERGALSIEKNNCILQMLSSADSKKESSTNSPTRESERVPDSGLLKEQLGQHVATLKEQDNSLKEEALLKKALTEECEDRSTVLSNESSCSLLSILNDNSEVKEAKPAVRLNSVPTREQDVSNGCGDKSKEENISAKIPITETKAYQLLKNSTLQDNTNQTEDRFQKASASGSQLSGDGQLSSRPVAEISKTKNSQEAEIRDSPAGLNIGSSAIKTKTTDRIASEASFSYREGSLLSRHENKKKLVTNLKSKAFWGESDDSNSEIEAALRPRNQNTPIDDFDDFYDS
ncbi:centrosomal protein kizuna isoform X3 [Nycticebus coucang]|uniref:centrosomal protein kizuna isoform X3 n=2 Tax=Nycticebus coucang TaxID=9470 RepID=UPI00234DFC86|nr:centrosomal protein kizuna isoform X3 [Nycticebus coucang]